MRRYELLDYFRINIINDFKLAKLSCNLPESVDLNLITAANIKEVLVLNKVMSGYIKKNIEKVVELAANGERQINQILVAKYKEGKSGKDANVEWYAGPLSKNGNSSNEKVDHKVSRKIFPVKSNQIICIKRKATEGIPGESINGKNIEVQKGKDIIIKSKNGIYIEESGDKIIYRSGISGHLKISKKEIVVKERFTISVKETLMINGDVDYSTGNINYFNDVIIKGDVLPGFIVESQKNILIEGHVEEGSYISAKGEIIINGGVIGENTVVYSEKNIRVRYVLNSTIRSENNIIVEQFVLNAFIFAKNRVEILGEKLNSRKAAVIGSIISTDVLIKVHSVGTDLSRISYLKICDYSEKIKSISAAIKDCRQKLQKILRTLDINLNSTAISKYIKNLPEDKRTSYKQILELIQYLIGEINRKKTEKKEIKYIISKNIDKAAIKIKYMIRPPATIIFNNKFKKIHTNDEGVKFTYSSFRGEIVVRN